MDINYNNATRTVTVNAKETVVPGQVEALNQKIALLTNENILLKKEKWTTKKQSIFFKGIQVPILQKIQRR